MKNSQVPYTYRIINIYLTVKQQTIWENNLTLKLNLKTPLNVPVVVSRQFKWNGHQKKEEESVSMKHEIPVRQSIWLRTERISFMGKYVSWYNKSNQ